MSKLAKALTAAAGNAGESLYVEDVFSTYLYTGTGSTQTITNGIDLAGEGGLVWSKIRNYTGFNHRLVDTERGTGNSLVTNSTAANYYQGFGVTSFNSDGYSLGIDAEYNWSGYNFASWTFRKAEKFFDVVTYTGTGAAQTISHNLGSDVGFMVIKRTDTTGFWIAWHKDFASTADGRLLLNTTDAYNTSSTYWNSTAPTSTGFTVGTNVNTNASGATYVAYLFASDAGGFGDDGSESIIKCGSYTGNGTAGLEIDLGFEPQWLLIKNADRSISWHLTDSMRGLNLTSRSELYPNLSNAEWTGSPAIVSPTATGFVLGGANTYTNFSGENFIYIAIRRPMKTPESGTEVFAVAPRSNTASADYAFVSNFPVDMGMARNVIGATEMNLGSRMTGDYYLKTPNTNAEVTVSSWGGWDSMNSASLGFGKSAESPVEKYAWMFKRATGFFDVVAYTGDGVAGSTQAHNLGVVPEMMIVKRRDGVSSWITYWDALGATKGQFLDSNQAFTSSTYWNDTAPTSTEFTLGSGSTNNSGATFIAYLFATLAGVSKVGSYTGDGNASQNIDCGFASGARFVLIKCTNVTGSWFVFDTARGIVAGNDSRLELNSTSAEVTNADVIDPYSAGFAVTNNSIAINVLGREYIYLAIA